MTVKEWATKEHGGARISAVQYGDPARAHVEGKGWTVLPPEVDPGTLDKELFDAIEKRHPGFFGDAR